MFARQSPNKAKTNGRLWACVSSLLFTLIEELGNGVQLLGEGKICYKGYCGYMERFLPVSCDRSNLGHAHLICEILPRFCFIELCNFYVIDPSTCFLLYTVGARTCHFSLLQAGGVLKTGWISKLACPMGGLGLGGITILMKNT